MVAKNPDLWTLTRLRRQIDPSDLAEAIASQIAIQDLDYRTRLLIRDGIDAMEHTWGGVRFKTWLNGYPYRDTIEAIRREEFDKVGFPSLKRRVVETTKPDEIRQFFEHLGKLLRVRERIRIEVAGSAALILPGYITRSTNDIDVVGEVPEVIRNNHRLIDELQDAHDLHLGHVQTHYFPMGWQDRAHYFDDFENLQVYLLDVYDVFLSKLFSARIKDMGDMRELLPQIEKDTLVRKLKDHCQSFLSAQRLKDIATDNWKILFGESLPS